MGCPTSQIDHIDLVYLQQGYKMFLGSQSKTATLIELKLFGSDHMTSESDHTGDPSNLADKKNAQPLKLTILT